MAATAVQSDMSAETNGCLSGTEEEMDGDNYCEEYSESSADSKAEETEPPAEPAENGDSSANGAQNTSLKEYRIATGNTTADPLDNATRQFLQNTLAQIEKAVPQTFSVDGDEDVQMKTEAVDDAISSDNSNIEAPHSLEGNLDEETKAYLDETLRTLIDQAVAGKPRTKQQLGWDQKFAERVQKEGLDFKQFCEMYESDGKKHFKCQLCGAMVIHRTNLLRHMRTHTGERPYACEVCGKRFKQPNNVHSHMAVHLNVTEFECSFCGEKFRLKSKFKAHIRTHDEDYQAGWTHKCDLCDKKYRSSTSLNRHMLMHSGEKPFACEHCHNRFYTKYDLEKHVRIHTGDRPYICGVCGKGFAQTSQLNTHLKYHTADKKHECATCGKKFAFMSAFKNHLIIHTGEKKFACDQCPKAFYQLANLKRHILSHTNLKPYECMSCGKHLTSKPGLELHMRIHTGEKPYKCTECDRCFASMSNLRIHKRKHTGEKPYQCTLCTEAFIGSAELERHVILWHSKEKRFACTVCGQKFALKSYVRSHMKTHNKKVYKCLACGKEYSREYHLKLHLKTHLKEVRKDSKIISEISNLISQSSNQIMPDFSPTGLNIASSAMFDTPGDVLPVHGIENHESDDSNPTTVDNVNGKTGTISNIDNSNGDKKLSAYDNDTGEDDSESMVTMDTSLTAMQHASNDGSCDSVVSRVDTPTHDTADNMEIYTVAKCSAALASGCSDREPRAGSSVSMGTLSHGQQNMFTVKGSVAASERAAVKDNGLSHSIPPSNEETPSCDNSDGPFEESQDVVLRNPSRDIPNGLQENCMMGRAVPMVAFLND